MFSWIFNRILSGIRLYCSSSFSFHCFNFVSNFSLLFIPNYVCLSDYILSPGEDHLGSLHFGNCHLDLFLTGKLIFFSSYTISQNCITYSSYQISVHKQFQMNFTTASKYTKLAQFLYLVMCIIHICDLIVSNTITGLCLSNI